MKGIRLKAWGKIKQDPRPCFAFRLQPQAEFLHLPVFIAMAQLPARE
jgi:hypothetical protein